MFERILNHFAADYKQSFLEKKYLITHRVKYQDMNENEIRNMKTWIYCGDQLSDDRWSWRTNRPKWINRFYDSFFFHK